MENTINYGQYTSLCPLLEVQMATGEGGTDTQEAVYISTLLVWSQVEWQNHLTARTSDLCTL